MVAGALAWALWGGGGNRSDNAYPPGRVPGIASGAAGAGSAAPAGPGGAGRTSGRPGATPAAVQAADGFIDELDAIDPVLVADRSRALANGRATCADIAAHRTPDEVARGVMQRFRVGSLALDKAKATLIADAARNHLCP
ncbi:MAG: hypothetical protein AUI10_11265 [Actinobacteria bacterium 13_2_20CM_2_72_6]|nr:MAG: hypothetical protein AUI10_11265 [Actinobacteria bacterium 13_2_20CM_2_72_6]